MRKSTQQDDDYGNATLEQPLLPGTSPSLPTGDPTSIDSIDGPSDGVVLISGGGTSLLGSTILLVKAIVGAGAAALPLAFDRLGSFFSVVFLLSVGYMTHFSVESLTLGLVVSGKSSYPGAVQSLLGNNAAILLDICIVVRCAGLAIVYIVISADLLAGSKTLPGLLCEFIASSSSSHQYIWCSDRHIIAGVLCTAVIVPLVTPRRLSPATSMLGLFAVTVWILITTSLIVVSFHNNSMTVPSFWPDMSALGQQVSLLSKITVALATIPVIATAYTCQMTVAFIMDELQNFSTKRMKRVSAYAMSVCSFIFLVVGFGSIIVFGHRLPADILEVFDTKELMEILGSRGVAKALGGMVRLGFLISIVATMPIQMLPFRQCLARICLGDDHDDFSGLGYFVVTYSSIVVFYFVAMSAESIWIPIQVVGATAGAAISFFYPAGVALAASKTRYFRWNAVILVIIGIVQVITGLTAVYLESQQRHRRLAF